MKLKTFSLFNSLIDGIRLTDRKLSQIYNIITVYHLLLINIKLKNIKVQQSICYNNEKVDLLFTTQST